MKNIQILGTAILALSSICCKKDKATIMEVGIQILVLNQQAQNLLTAPSQLNENNIELYYVKNGHPVLYYESNLKAAKGFLIEPLDGLPDIGLKIIPNPGSFETTSMEYPVTFIKLGNLGTDTIKCEVLNSENSKIISKVWYNGVLKYDQNLKQGPRRFTIVK